MSDITQPFNSFLYSKSAEISGAGVYDYVNIKGSGNLQTEIAEASGVARKDANKLTLDNGSELTKADIADLVGKFYYNTSYRAGALITNTFVDASYSDPPPKFDVFLDVAVNTSFGRYKIVDMPKVERTMDYKIQPDFKNFYYFNDTSEWVVYHTFDDESYYGNRFFPTIGAVICYDENDSQIHPSDIIYCPDVISNGVFEASKVIVRWASAQTGKCCFNSGISADEKYDQSRLIFSMSQNEFIPDSTLGGYEIYGGIDVEAARNRRAIGNINTEPYLTVDSVNNGKVVDYSIIGDGTTPEAGKIRIKSDRLFLNAMDDFISQKTYNDDVINTLVFSSSSVDDLLNTASFFPGISNDYLRLSNGEYYIINLSDIQPDVTGFSDLNLADYFSVSGVFYATVENVGYIYDESSDKPYQLHIYINGMESIASTIELNLDGLLPLMNNMRDIKLQEQYSPMIKLNHCACHYKIIKKNSNFERRVSVDGLYEQEYIIETTCCPGSSEARAEAVPEATFVVTDYKNTLIMYPNSMIKAGKNDTETSERVEILNNDSFTTYVVAPTNFSLQTYRKNNGGGIAPTSSSGKSTITYPKQSIYRSVTPDQFYSNLVDNTSTPDTTTNYNVNLLGGFTDEGEPSIATPVNSDVRVFVLHSNKKWRYNKNKFESYSGRENPSYIFEIDSTALIESYIDNILESPSLPDTKRWFTSYCRGFAYTRLVSDESDVTSGDSDSELVLDIWDSKSLIGTDDNADRTGNWRSLTPSNFDKYPYMNTNKQYENPNGVLATATIGDEYSLVGIHGTEEFNIEVDDYIGFILSGQTVPDKYYRIVAKIGFDPTAGGGTGFTYYQVYYKDQSGFVNTVDAKEFRAYKKSVYINKFKTFKFGGDKLANYYDKIDKYLDIKSGATVPISAFKFGGAASYIADIDADIGTTMFSQISFSGLPYGRTGDGEVWFESLSTTNKLNSTSLILDDFSRESVFSCCIKGRMEDVTIGTAGHIHLMKFSSSTTSSYLSVILTCQLKAATISIGWDLGGGVSTKTILNDPRFHSDGTFDFMLVKNGTTFSLHFNNYTTEFEMKAGDTGDVLDVMDIGAFGSPTAPRSWFLDKFYTFNKIIGWPSGYDYFVVDDFNFDSDDVVRYIDSDNKIYLRARAAKGRYRLRDFNDTFGNPQVAKDYTNTSKVNVDRDRFTQYNPWSADAAAGNAFDWKKLEIKESIDKIGLDYFKSESK